MSRKQPVLSSTGGVIYNTKLLMELEALAERMGIQVIREKLSDSRSGFCRLHDQYLLLMEKNLEEETQLEVFLDVLSQFPLDDLHVLPGIRKILQEHRLPGQIQEG